MGQRIDQFCENLRLKLTNIDSNISALKAKIDARARTAEQDVRDHLDAVQRLVDQGRAKVTVAQADMKKWADEQKTFTKEKIVQWKAARDVAKLQSRAELAEAYAAAASDVAIAAVDEAERSSLEAWLARHDADDALA
jgi:hypothetical protein